MNAIRYLYTAATFAARDEPFYMNRTQVIAFLARDDDEARTWALAHGEHLWPAAKGWRHDASILRVADHLIAGHGQYAPPPTWEDEQ